jgi:hypothetical protein
VTFRQRPPSFLLILLAGVLVLLSGCKRFQHIHHGDYVYVMAQKTFLRDRVAAVSNRVAMVNNGERLEVMERGRRFLKVKTEAGAVGWLEDHMVIDQATYDKFKALHDDHQKDVSVATAVLRDDLYAHLLPGRDTPRFLMLPENDKLQLLQRASVLKPDAQNAWMHPTNSKAPAKPVAHAKKGGKAGHEPKESSWLAQFVDPNAPPMEDWWLVRDAAGRVGWVLAHRMDTDVPDEVVQYSEGQRIVGAYLLDKVSDPDSKFPDGQAPDYLVVLSPYRDGLPYDFDQVRVYAWNVKKHRYEGAYRKRDIAGYLPVTVTHQVEETTGAYASVPVPVFTVKVATKDAQPALDAQTGLVKAVPTEAQTFSLEGETVKRLASAAPVVASVAASAAAPAPKSATPGAPSSTKAEKHRRPRHHEAGHHRKHATA